MVVVALKTRPDCFSTAQEHIREEVLWQARQLGDHSPVVLLNTLMYFNVKYFRLHTVDQHLQLTLSDVTEEEQEDSEGQKMKILRSTAICQEQQSEPMCCDQPQNLDNPHRCPVKLYQLYLSKWLSLLGLPNLEPLGATEGGEPVQWRCFHEVMRNSGLRLPDQLQALLWTWQSEPPREFQVGRQCLLQDVPSLVPGAPGCAGVRPSESPPRRSTSIELIPRRSGPDTVKSQQGTYYMVPDRTCNTEAAVWYSSSPLGKDTISRMLTRFSVVEEVKDISSKLICPA
ncbi:hypothetical protein HPB50_012108 [Hyalomma asiaticum]|uniref:Uncharacterized protein n=1 Tax=Hyalomma asiaticum TaxID=266040 RepID=A0ACB7S5T4_HYAAI|nr:hypothetical protein HPB50_012108 [Hyalomma asiaticum]